MRLVKVNEINRDEELGILKKNISMPNIPSFETPSKSIRFLEPNVFLESNSKVTEITKRVDNSTLDSLMEGASSRIVKGIQSKFKRDKLNLVIFDLIFSEMPDKDKLRILAQHLYASSDVTILLPTVRTAFFNEGNKISEKKLDNYLEMMRFIINDIQAIGNAKVFIGTIPLLIPKYSKPIVELYIKQGITSFCIDGHLKDILSNVGDFRFILAKINDELRLNETFVYACNLGYPHFEKEETRADDFLSIFAYIDVLGGTFKFKGKMSGEPRLKKFSKERYSYKIRPSRSYPINVLKNYNQCEQLIEAIKVRDMIGVERIKPYVQKKAAVDNLSIERLESIATNVRVN